jgi:hypothetical protein
MYLKVLLVAGLMLLSRLTYSSGLIEHFDQLAEDTTYHNARLYLQSSEQHQDVIITAIDKLKNDGVFLSTLPARYTAYDVLIKHFLIVKDTVDDSLKENVVNVLLDGMNDENVGIRLLCSKALGFIDSSVLENSIISGLIAGLSDSDIRVIEHCLQSLSGFGESAKSALGIINKIIKRVEPNLGEKWANKIALGYDTKSEIYDPESITLCWAIYAKTKIEGITSILENSNPQDQKLNIGLSMAFAKYVIGSGGLKGVSYEEQENIVSSLINNLDSSDDLYEIDLVIINGLSTYLNSSEGDVFLKEYILAELQSYLDGSSNPDIKQVISGIMAGRELYLRRENR